jgi:hypothetical protein
VPDVTLPNRILFHRSRLKEIKRVILAPEIVHTQLEAS